MGRTWSTNESGRTDYDYTCIGRRQAPIERPLIRISFDVLFHDDDFNKTGCVLPYCFLMKDLQFSISPENSVKSEVYP